MKVNKHVVLMALLQDLAVYFIIHISNGHRLWLYGIRDTTEINKHSKILLHLLQNISKSESNKIDILIKI